MTNKNVIPIVEVTDFEPTVRKLHSLHVKIPGDLWARFKRFYPSKGDVQDVLRVFIRQTVERLEARNLNSESKEGC
jgi:hypothetical protein